MVIEIHRVMLLCVIVLLTGSIFRTQAVATDSRVTDLANKAGIRILRDSSSDKQLQKTAASRVPLARMSQQSQQRAIYLLKNTSQYRRMPSLQYEVDASLYQYLINHPDVAIATWRVMGISKLNMWQTEPFEYAAEANDGSKGQADVLWRDGNQCLFVVEGAYHSPLLPSAVEASALVWMRYRFERTRDNRILVNQQIETFVNFPSPAIETIAKLASMVTNSILDRNVMEVSLYAQMMSRALKKDSNWVEEVAARMDGVPEHRKVELTRVARGMNPYESQTNGQDVRLSATQLQIQKTDRTADTVFANRAAAAADNTLSPSKQQLLQEVRAGNVIVIVKPKKQAQETLKAAVVGKKNHSAKSDSIKSASLSEALQPSVAVLTMEVTSTPSTDAKRQSRDLTIASATDPSTDSPHAPWKATPQPEASGPTQAVLPESKSAEAREFYTGHSKDGSIETRTVNSLVTGPVTTENKAVTDNGMTAAISTAIKSDSTASRQSATAGSNGDQPALITLPPVIANE